MKHIKKEELKNSPDNDTVQHKKDYAATEQSPYQNWRDRTGNFTQDGARSEFPQANPDVLSESIWPPEDRSEDKLKLKALEEAFKDLTTYQREILYLYAKGGRTFEEVAMILGISVSTVFTQVIRIRKKIIKRYKKYGRRQ